MKEVLEMHTNLQYCTSISARCSNCRNDKCDDESA